jgi:hypothetical protein
MAASRGRDAHRAFVKEIDADSVFGKEAGAARPILDLVGSSS